MAFNRRVIFLLLFLGACAPKGVSPQRLQDIVQEGKDVTWPDGRTIHVRHRYGSRLEGVRLLRSRGAAPGRSVEADHGFISVDPDGRTVRVTLYQATMRVGTNAVGSVKEFSVIVSN